MRKITEHIVEGDAPQNQLKVEVKDKPGAGGASHRYVISGHNVYDNPSSFSCVRPQTTILFQNGPINESGLNGLTQEVLLAIVIDRLRSFQAGPFHCAENATALKACEIALDALKFRTECRIKRGVEGQTKA